MGGGNVVKPIQQWLGLPSLTLRHAVIEIDRVVPSSFQTLRVIYTGYTLLPVPCTEDHLGGLELWRGDRLGRRRSHLGR